MPQRVLDHVPVDYVVNPLELPGLLVRLVATMAGRPPEMAAEVQQLEGDSAGAPAELVCPTLIQGHALTSTAGRKFVPQSGTQNEVPAGRTSN
jgi:hypothetical protein